MALRLGGLPPKGPEPQPHHEKNIKQTQTEGRSTKYLTSPPQNDQGHQKHRKSEKLSQSGGG